MTKAYMIRSFARAATVAAFALACAAGGASAQEVHKCTVDGRVTYQATPCRGADKVLQAPRTPDEEQVEAARRRADAQKAKAAPGAAQAAPGASAPGSNRARDNLKV